MNQLLVFLSFIFVIIVETVTQEDVVLSNKEEITEVNTSTEETVETEKGEEEEPEYRRVGFATHTPCGDGVISQVLENNRAVVILFASYYSRPLYYE